MIVKKVLVCGDRNWTDAHKILDRIEKLPPSALIITGGCRGADQLADDIAAMLGFDRKIVFADWTTYGRAAGPIRNRKMLDEKPDLVIAFHSNIAHSRGTKDCVTEALRRGIQVEVIS